MNRLTNVICFTISNYRDKNGIIKSKFKAGWELFNNEWNLTELKKLLAAIEKVKLDRAWRNENTSTTPTFKWLTKLVPAKTSMNDFVSEESVNIIGALGLNLEI